MKIEQCRRYFCCCCLCRRTNEIAPSDRAAEGQSHRQRMTRLGAQVRSLFETGFLKRVSKQNHSRRFAQHWGRRRVQWRVCCLKNRRQRLLNLAAKSVEFTYFIINFQWAVVPLMVVVLLTAIFSALFPAVGDDTAAAAVFFSWGQNKRVSEWDIKKSKGHCTARLDCNKFYSIKKVCSRCFSVDRIIIVVCSIFINSNSNISIIIYWAILYQWLIVIECSGLSIFVFSVVSIYVVYLFFERHRCVYGNSRSHCCKN